MSGSGKIEGNGFVAGDFCEKLARGNGLEDGDVALAFLVVLEFGGGNLAEDGFEFFRFLWNSFDGVGDGLDGFGGGGSCSSASPNSLKAGCRYSLAR